MKNRPTHRGAVEDIPLFAKRFIKARIGGFEKDMNICLTPAKLNGQSLTTHAYFPALSACCGTLEYLAALYSGNVNGLGWPQVANWADHYLPQPDYNRDTVRVLVLAFRNSVAHRGIASGVWIDPRPPNGHLRRLTWKLLADTKHPTCELVEEQGTLRKDPPWPCNYTHRVHIHLRGLQVDIRNASIKFSNAIANDYRLQHNFEACMQQLYPA